MTHHCFLTSAALLLVSSGCTPQQAFDSRDGDASSHVDASAESPQTSNPTMTVAVSTTAPSASSTASPEVALNVDSGAAPDAAVVESDECTFGERRCSPLSVQACNANGEWVDETICSPGTECLLSTLSCGDCSEGEVQCQDQGTRSVCHEGHFAREACAAPTPYCEDGRCVACTAESPEACVDNAPVRCIDSAWQTLPVCSGQTPICDSSIGACVECVPGAIQCTPQGQSAVCGTNGNWSVNACGSDVPFCLEGKCLACDPSSGARRCQANGVEVCDASGAWGLEEACSESSRVCLESIADCGDCEAGDTQCNDDATGLSICDETGAFSNVPCPESKPVCSEGECVACASGAGHEFTCAASTPLFCAANTWVPQAPCAGDSPVCDADTGQCVCENGARRCESNTLQECTSGAWVPLETCGGETPVCDESAGKCACAEGTSKCVVGIDDSRLVCEGGAWIEDLCRDEAPVCHEGECSECVPGSPSQCAEPTLGADYYGGGQLKLYCSAAATWEEEPCDHLCNGGSCLDTRKIEGSYSCDIHYGIVCTSPQICCATRVPQCVDNAADCGNIAPGLTAKAVRATCDDRSDCAPGQVCCYHHKASNGSIPLVQCEEPEDCANLVGGMGSYDRVICGPNDPCSDGTCTVYGQRGVSECEP